MCEFFFQEAKEAGHRFRYYKPTAFHWQKFAEIATKAGVLKQIIQLAYSQAIWQFVETLAVTKINKSTHQAKENAVMTLVYINAIRITIALIMDGQNEQLFPLNFMNKTIGYHLLRHFLGPLVISFNKIATYFY